MVPFPSLLGLLQRHRRVELPQGQGKRLPVPFTADLGQALRGQSEGDTVTSCQHRAGKRPTHTPAAFPLGGGQHSHCLQAIHETPEIRSHGKGCGFPSGDKPIRTTNLGHEQDPGHVVVSRRCCLATAIPYTCSTSTSAPTGPGKSLCAPQGGLGEGMCTGSCARERVCTGMRVQPGSLASVVTGVCLCVFVRVKGLALISAGLHTQTAGEQSVTDKAGSSPGQGSGEGMGTLRPTQGQSPKRAPGFPRAERAG